MTVRGFDERDLPDTLVLFDVDGTLTPARQDASPEVLDKLRELREKCAIGFVGGSDLAKQQGQLAQAIGANVIDMFDYCFAENGLTAYRLGKELPSQTFINWLGEAKYKPLANFILHYIADLDIPIKRGTFIEFRTGMINVSPIGRNATIQERLDFQAYDNIHKVRSKMITELRKNFPDYGLTYSIGGQISFDVFPTGWDKTYCLRHIESDPHKFTKIHFFGDKAFQGGNDWEIYNDPRTIGHAIANPDETIKILNQLFLS